MKYYFKITKIGVIISLASFQSIEKYQPRCSHIIYKGERSSHGDYVSTD